MPHITIHFHRGRPMPDDATCAVLTERAVTAAVDALGCHPEVVTVSLAPTEPDVWDTVLARAQAEGHFLRLPTYATGVRFDA